ncbi:very long chain fatty acid elongase 4-like [Babylonia areolata]|uniref:very long chain fatty acid elongase 4-like n=1 Tax=Babylonia areolata TaxID=304850 RepID=UPI003FD6BA45
MSMASLVELYSYSMDHLSDPRTKDWLLMTSPWPTVLLVLLYWLTIGLGQRLMASRPPFDLQKVMVVYNLALVLLSAYMVHELVVSSWMDPGFNMNCALVDTSDNDTSLRFARVVWWYYFSKLIEFADTVIFVLRKKTSQISFLHMYHHSSMPVLWWIGTRFAPGGEAFFSATLNSFVHVVMYSYYMLSAMGPHMQPYLWWKKYLTSLQLLQFLLILGRVSYTLYTGCEYPRLFQKILLVYMFTLITLFSNFYYQTYHLRQQRSSTRAKTNGSISADGKLTNGNHVHDANGKTKLN